MSKILRFVLILLFLISLGEIGYYFFYDSLPIINHKNTRSFLPTINSMQVAPTIFVRDPSTTKSSSFQEGIFDENQAISEDVIKTLRIFKKDTLTFATLVTYFSGTITEIEIAEATTDWGYKYVAKLRIRGEQGNTNAFIFNETELSNLKVLKKSDMGDDQTINFDQLKVGDQVTTKALFDLMEGPEAFQIERITLLP